MNENSAIKIWAIKLELNAAQKEEQISYRNM